MFLRRYLRIQPSRQGRGVAVTPSPINFRVEDLFNFSVNLDQRWWRLNSIQNGAWVGEFELGDMKDRVH